MPEYPVILGVYSLKQESDIGMGDTASRRETMTYWFARQTGPDRFDVQPLNIYHVPSGVVTHLDGPDFLRKYTPEPQYYRMYTVPALNSLARKLAEGEDMLSEGKLDDAEKAFIKALMIDEQHVKANYGLGTVYSEKKDLKKLAKVIGTLLNIEDAFSQEFREQFNSFGINLRRNRHYDAALKFYERALELDAMDEHVYFNMARAHYDKNALEECVNALDIALAINPDFAEARKFLEHCKRKMEGQGAPEAGQG